MRFRTLALVAVLSLLASAARSEDKVEPATPKPEMSTRERIVTDRAKADAEIKEQGSARPWDRDASGKRPWDPSAEKPANRK